MGIKDLFAGERGFFALLLVVASTVLTALGVMSIEMWKEHSMEIFTVFAGAKTLTTVTGLIMARKTEPAPASPTATSSPTTSSPLPQTLDALSPPSTP